MKCAAELREIGNAFQMYAIENKGAYPPSQINMASGFTYDVDGVTYPITDPSNNSKYGAYWFTFLAKYVTKAKLGIASSNDIQAAQAKNSIFWRCPSWQGYTNNPGIGGTDESKRPCIGV